MTVPSSPEEAGQVPDKPVSWRLRQWAFLCALDVYRIDQSTKLLALASEIVSFVTSGEDGAGNA